MRRLLILTVVLVLLLSLYSALAQVPRTIAYQGVLTDTLGNAKPDGAYNMTFRLYDVAGGGVAFWSETKSVTVKHGVFMTYLGSTTPLAASIPFDRTYYLGITPQGTSELSPRTVLSSVPYSLRAANADSAKYVASPAIPAGPAGGDLSGTYPNPTVKKITRNISFTARSLVTNPGSVAIYPDGSGLHWKTVGNEGAFLYCGKPSDWDGTSDVTLTIYFLTTTATAGNWAFFIRPRAFSPGDTWADAPGITSTAITNSGTSKLYAQSFTIPATRFGTKDLWVTTIQYNTTSSTYPDDVVVNTVTLSYVAVR